MALSTDVARELFLYSPPGEKRVTSVKELAQRLGRKLKSLSVTDEDYPRVQRCYLAAERRWSRLSGVGRCRTRRRRG